MVGGVRIYRFLYLVGSWFIFLGVLFSVFIDDVSLFKQLTIIISEPDQLLTDYLEIAGLGGAFVNSGLLMIGFTTLLKLMKIALSGVSIAAIFTIGGFALFGKNLFNVTPIIVGVFLYTLLSGQNMKTYLYVALFGTALAPMATHFVFSGEFGHLGIFLAILTGFLLPPLSSFCLTLHRGYNLYNVGFTAGFLGMILGAFLKGFGVEPKMRMVIHTENQYLLGVIMYSTFIAILMYGLYKNKGTFKGYSKIFKYPGKLLTDFVLLENEGITLINVALLGFLGTTYVVATRGILNGPTIGGIMTLAGFGGLGKHPKNVLPVMLGVSLGAAFNTVPFNSVSMTLAALFGTTLAPIAGEFGVVWGIIAGFIHSELVLNVGFLHHGLNLYNNGFSGGFVTIFLIPFVEAYNSLKASVLKTILRRKENEQKRADS